jgi:hypothetical protein
MRPKVIWTCLRDLQIDKRPNRERAGNKDQPIDLRGVTPRPTHADWFAVAGVVLGLTDRLDQDLQRLAHQRLVLVQGDRLLRLHDRVAALLGDLLRHRGKIERHRLGARFGGVGEDADVVELLLLNEVEQGLELCVGFAGVADDEGGAHHDVRHPGSGVVDEAAGHVDVAGAVHVPEHGRVGMLDRHVEVGQQRVVLGHDVDHA